MDGQQAMMGPMDVNRAMAEYRKKYNDKIKNYTEIHINYGEDEDE